MSPRILLLDIETAPSKGFYFNPYAKSGTNILHVEQHWHLLSFSYKWLGEKGVKVRGLPDYPAYQDDRGNDRDLLRELHGLVDESDAIVAHHGDGFDLPKVRARLVLQGFRPPSPSKSIDTYKLAKRFGFDFRNLNFLAQQLGVGSKLPHTGAHMWLGCVRDNPLNLSEREIAKAWANMKRYNAHDVHPLLEGVYDKLKAWGAHPNLAYLTREHSCPTCQSSKLQHRGWTYLKASKRRRLQCQDCGAWSSGAETIAIPKV